MDITQSNQRSTIKAALDLLRNHPVFSLIIILSIPATEQIINWLGLFESNSLVNLITSVLLLVLIPLAISLVGIYFIVEKENP